MVLPSFQSTIYVASYHGRCDCWAFGAFRPGGRIHSSILGVGRAVLCSEREEGGQVDSSIHECVWMG